MKFYRGRRSDDDQEAIVEVVDDAEGVRRLVPRPDLEGVKTATGFAWGYRGSGPKQLAIALLADAVSDEVARDWHHQFRVAKLEPIPIGQRWMMTDADIMSWWQETSPGWSAARRN